MDALRRWSHGTLRDVFGFDLPILRPAKDVVFLRRLLRFVGNVNVTSEYRGLDLCCLKSNRPVLACERRRRMVA